MTNSLRGTDTDTSYDDDFDMEEFSGDLRLQLIVDRYELIMQATNEGWWDWNLISGEIGFSPGWVRQLGYDPDEVTNAFEEWRDRIHPDDRPAVLAAIDAHLSDTSNAVPYDIEYRIQCRSGDYRWMRSTGACFRDEHGRAYRFAGSQSDIHDRKLAEDALRESQRKLDTLLSSLPGMAYR